MEKEHKIYTCLVVFAWEKSENLVKLSLVCSFLHSAPLLKLGDVFCVIFQVGMARPLYGVSSYAMLEAPIFYCLDYCRPIMNVLQ